MADLTPVKAWDNVYQLAIGDSVIGGPGGTSNLQAQLLLNRSKLAEEILTTNGEVTTTVGLTLGTSHVNKLVKYTNGSIANITLTGLDMAHYLDGEYVIIQNDRGTSGSNIEVISSQAMDVDGIAVSAGSSFWIVDGETVMFKKIKGKAEWLVLGSTLREVGMLVAVPVKGGILGNRRFLVNSTASATLSTTLYPRLFAHIGIAYGNTGGAGTFDTPNMPAIIVAEVLWYMHF